MGSRFRLSAYTLGVALMGVLSVPTPASAAPCPANNVSIDGVCTRPSPSATPSPDPDPGPDPTPDPTPTQTHTPRPTQTSSPKPRPTQTVATPVVTPTPSRSATVPPSVPPTNFPGYPTDLPTFGEDRPSFPTSPGLAASPSDSVPQGQGMQILGLLFLASLIAFLLVRARVRRWMIGI